MKVTWQGNTTIFSDRYYGEVSKSEAQTTPHLEELSLYTRHHNGYIREIAIIAFMQKFPMESIPYIVQLLGEYVVEIHLRILENMTPEQKNWLQEFLQENPRYAQTIQSRIASYWDCYYRSQYPKLRDYPANRLINNR
ncbi:hypothetical protein HXZ94_07440 [Empedobacter falsenii]|uniref:hypothetical protein n=1 Tax=Empedobacter falsenii TaxID=343874 RepID=UPI002577C011|nr:hypothetical protein [Empedobacter falsenii]MDM1298334.1 hypothetical protein [Empedobacter falsenii]MDM1318109.1 hypothetical protein [Empedobacter falsenii]